METTRVAKVAAIFVDGAPHFNCPCGERVGFPAWNYPDGGNVKCECGYEFDARGWVVSAPKAIVS